MARLPLLVLPGIPYHVTQRGNRREQTFFEEADYNSGDTTIPGTPIPGTQYLIARSR